MARHFTFWPPPWKMDTTLRQAGAILWLLAMTPIVLVATLVAVPVSLVSKLTGWGATESRTREQVCQVIEQFLDGTGNPWDWDDFLSVADADPILEQARVKCAELPDRFPPRSSSEYCGPEGLEELRRIVRDLQAADG